MDTGSRWNRDHILNNQRAGKIFAVKNSIAKRFCEAEKKLKDMATTLTYVNLKAIRTEIELKGTMMCLMVREKKPVGRA